MQSPLQQSEIPLRDFERGWAIMAPGGDPHRSRVELQFNTEAGLLLYKLSPEEAYTIGHSLCMHAEECGFDYDTGETTLPDA